MADSGMPAGPNMDEVLYERVIHDKPWMWALVNAEFQPTPPPRFSTDPWGWWLLVHRMMVDDWSFEFHSPGARLPGDEDPITVFHVRLTRQATGRWKRAGPTARPCGRPRAAPSSTPSARSRVPASAGRQTHRTTSRPTLTMLRFDYGKVQHKLIVAAVKLDGRSR